MSTTKEAKASIDVAALLAKPKIKKSFSNCKESNLAEIFQYCLDNPTSGKDTAAKFGLSNNRFYYLVQKYNSIFKKNKIMLMGRHLPSNKKYDDEIILQVLSDIESGVYTIVQAAEVHKIPSITIRGWVKNYKINLPDFKTRKTYSADFKKQVLDYASKTGAPVREIAKKFSLSTGTIGSWISKSNINLRSIRASKSLKSLDAAIEQIQNERDNINSSSEANLFSGVDHINDPTFNTNNMAEDLALDEPPVMDNRKLMFCPCCGLDLKAAAIAFKACLEVTA